jgi:hypothetical protein
VRVADRDVEGWLCGLLDADARLGLARLCAGRLGLYGWCALSADGEVQSVFFCCIAGWSEWSCAFFPWRGGSLVGDEG